MGQCWFMLVLLLTASEFETTYIGDTLHPNIHNFAFPSLPSYWQLCGQNWIAFFWMSTCPDHRAPVPVPDRLLAAWIEISISYQGANPHWTWDLPVLRGALAPPSLLLTLFPTCTGTLSRNTSQESAFLSKMVLPFPSRFCMLFKGLPCAPSSALQKGIVLWLWKLPPFFHCWMATKLTIPIYSIQHAKGLLLLCQQLCFHLQLFTHPLRSLCCPDGLTVQGHMWLLYRNCSILLIYLVSKRDHFGDHPCPVKYWFFCCSNWSSDFSFPNISL